MGDPWLTVADYKEYARIDPTDTADDSAIDAAVAASMSTIELRAPLAFPLDPETGEPLFPPVPADVFQAGLLLTNRLMSRRNSPDGVVGVSEMGTATIRPGDSDITGLLSPWTDPVVA